MLQISQLTISSPTNDILQGITLHLKSGESVAIVGESGSGKTTLIKSILALPLANLRQTAGHIQFEDQTIELTNEAGQKAQLHSPEFLSTSQRSG
ncbi:TPA: ATP-binding cassette domain-containing protein [Streptococcus suis]